MFLVLKSLTQSPLFTFNAQLGGKKKKQINKKDYFGEHTKWSHSQKKI